MEDKGLKPLVCAGFLPLIFRFNPDRSWDIDWVSHR